MGFLPEGYEVPKNNSSYTKWLDGGNKVRILSSSIVGYEYFNTDNKPIRSRTKFDTTPDIKANGKVKEFWAFIVYNYGTKNIEICEVTQAGIKNAIYNLYLDEDYGDPKGYDLKVQRKGEGLETEYTVMPSPKKELDKDIKELFENTNIDLDKLFDGKDPFNS